MKSAPDPRPQVVNDGSGPRIVGCRCERCGYSAALPAPWCPRCRGGLRSVTFQPGGVVWSATVLRVALPDRPPPTSLAYVDIDDGPRVLGHVADRTDDRLRAGDRVKLTGLTEAGDLRFGEETL